MYLIHNYPLNVHEMLEEPLAREHDLEGLRGGDEYLWRVLRLFGPLMLGGVTVPYANTYAELLSEPLEPLQHVPVERPQRRDVEHKESFGAGLENIIQDRQDGSLCLAYPCRGDKQNVPFLLQQRYHAFLCL